MAHSVEREIVRLDSWVIDVKMRRIESILFLNSIFNTTKRHSLFDSKASPKICSPNIICLCIFLPSTLFYVCLFC